MLSNKNLTIFYTLLYKTAALWTNSPHVTKKPIQSESDKSETSKISEKLKKSQSAKIPKSSCFGTSTSVSNESSDTHEQNPKQSTLASEKVKKSRLVSLSNHLDTIKDINIGIKTFPNSSKVAIFLKLKKIVKRGKSGNRSKKRVQ